MTKKTLLLCGLLLTTACQEKDSSNNRKVSAAVPPGSSDDAISQEIEKEEERDENIQQSSLSALDEHMQDIVDLRQAALGGSQTPEFPDVFSAANSLVTKYDFEVKKALKDGDFRMAAYQWDLAEIHYKVIEESIEAGSISTELGSAWGEFVASREELLDKKEIWNQY